MNAPRSGGRQEAPEAVIAGAGLAGSLAALVLAQAGWRVRVFEQRADPRDSDQREGRSVNLGLSARGLAALEYAGLTDQVRAMTVPMRGRAIHHHDGRVRFAPYGLAEHEVLRSIDRQELLRVLLTAAEGTGRVRFDFGVSVTSVTPTGLVLSPAPPDSADGHLAADLVLGADGAFSAVRRAKEVAGECRCELTIAPWQYKELTIPAAPDGTARTRLEALHVWPAEQALIVAHPNLDRSLTATLFLPESAGSVSVDRLTTEEQVVDWLDRDFPDSAELMPGRAEEFLHHPPGRLVTVRARPWSFDGRILLIGDAAHGVYPFYGQGMNAAFEDVLVLAELLRAHRDDVAAVVAEFEAARRPHLDVLADLSEQNFHQLQRTTDRLHRWRSRLDLVLARTAPRAWVPLYTMISHRRTPYADALRRARRQDRVLLGAATTVLSTALGLGLLLGRRLVSENRRARS